MAIAASLIGSRGEVSTGSSVATGSGTSTGGAGTTFRVYLAWFPAANGGADLAGTPIDDNKGNTFAQVGSTATTANGDLKTGVWECVGGTGGAGHIVTAHFSGAAAFASIYLVEVTGAATSSPRDSSSVGGVLGTQSSPYNIGPTGTLSQANNAVLAFIAADTGQNVAWGSSNFTILDSQPSGASFWPVALGRVITSAATAVTPNFTRTGNSACQLSYQIDVIKEATAPSAPASVTYVDPRRNRPGRGPYSTGRFFRPVGETTVLRQAITGAFGGQLGDVTLSAAGQLAIAGSTAVTLADATLSAAGQLAIAGSTAVTLGDVTLSAAGALALVAAASVTLGDVTLSAAGTIALTGALDVTLDDATLSAAGALALTADLGVTLDDATLSAEGTGASGGILDVTLDDVTVSAAGTLALVGASSVTLGDVALSAAGAVAITGSASIVLDDLTISAEGVLSSGSGTGATAAEIWGFVLSDGRTAEEELVDMRLKVDELWRQHGLDVANPLVVTPTSRVAGTQAQTITEVGSTVTVSRT